MVRAWYMTLHASSHLPVDVGAINLPLDAPLCKKCSEFFGSDERALEACDVSLSGITFDNMWGVRQRQGSRPECQILEWLGAYAKRCRE